MHVLKDTNDTRVVGIPLGEGSSGIMKYQVQRRFGTCAYETISEVTIVGPNHSAENALPANTLSISDLQILISDASKRLVD